MRNWEELIRNVSDFPKAGIQFKDITTLLVNGPAFRDCIDELAAQMQDVRADLVVAPEARGFILGSALAYKLGCGFVPVRKPGKLPADTVRVVYDLEYGQDELEMHRDAIQPGQRVILSDDLLATGGSCRAVIELVHRMGGEVVACAFLVELNDLLGRLVIDHDRVISLLQV